jgi:ADP-ribose pyrophosphatase YjhB (NUDIX family)
MSQIHGDRYRSIVDIHIILVRDNRILLGLRINTGYADDHYHLPAGHLEMGESVVSGAIREAHEELGVFIQEGDLRLVHFMHHRSTEGRLALFFEARQWAGVPQNREPSKCKQLDWFALDMLPDQIVPYAREALQHYQSGISFGLSGWESGLSRREHEGGSADGY